MPPKRPRQFSLFKENRGARAGPSSWGQLYGNDSSSPWPCPALAEGGEQAPLAKGEAEKKWIGPQKCEGQSEGSTWGRRTELCVGRDVLRVVGEVVSGSRV